jgi:UDP-N-acetylmuramate dehydrogenase
MLLKDISYYNTGGSADRIYMPASIEELSLVMKEIHEDKIPYFLLGEGSNSLVMDDHWPGAVITFSNLNSLKIEGNKVNAQAGVENTRFAKICLESSLGGASWMYYLPGQIGSTVRMNARCYGAEISQIVEKVTSVSRKGEMKTYPGKEVFTGYKDTIFCKNDEVVAEVTFSLEKGEQSTIREQMNVCETDRNNKKQFLHPSCGCVFKNDYNLGIPSGLILESAGVRQLGSDRVQISPHHANILFNKGATAAEILTTALDMRDLAYQKFGVWLEFEMELLGVVPAGLKRRVEESKETRLKERELELLMKKFNQKQRASSFSTERLHRIKTRSMASRQHSC